MRVIYSVIVSVLALLFLEAATPMTMQTTINTQTTCPRGVSWGDDCQNAQLGGLIYPGLLSLNTGGSPTTPVYQQGVARQSGQKFVVDIPWNVVGRDQPAGFSYNAAQILDPTTATLPGACSYSSSNQTVNCYPSGPLTLANYDFSLHNCVNLYISGSGTTTLLNDNFVNGTNCNGVHQSGLVDVIGPALSITVINSTFNGGAPTLEGGGSGWGDMALIFMNSWRGNITVKHSVFLNDPGRPIEANTIGGVDFENNFIEGMVYNGANGHGETIINSFQAWVGACMNDGNGGNASTACNGTDTTPGNVVTVVGQNSVPGFLIAPGSYLYPNNDNGSGYGSGIKVLSGTSCGVYYSGTSCSGLQFTVDTSAHGNAYISYQTDRTWWTDATSAYTIYRYNTCIMDSNEAQPSTTSCFYIDTGAYRGGWFNYVLADHNVILNNWGSGQNDIVSTSFEYGTLANSANQTSYFYQNYIDSTGLYSCNGNLQSYAGFNGWSGNVNMTNGNTITSAWTGTCP